MKYKYEIKLKDGSRIIARSDYDYKTYVKRIMGSSFLSCEKKLIQTSDIVGIYEKKPL